MSSAEGDLSLSDEQSEGLFRIIQEALTNVIKHAGAKRAEVTLRAEDGQVAATVEDSGAGFDPAFAAAIDGHYGMAGMRERTQLLGGDFSITSSPGKGTRVTVQVPVGNKENRSGEDHRPDR